MSDCCPNKRGAIPRTFGDAREIVIVAFRNLLACSFPFVRMVLQHNGFVCCETNRECDMKHRERKKKKKGHTCEAYLRAALICF